MNLSEIPQKQIVTIDTDIFFLAMERASMQCVSLLEKCAGNEISGVITSQHLAELIYRLMVKEAQDLGLIKPYESFRELLEIPDKAGALKKYEPIIHNLLSIGIILEDIQDVDWEIIRNIGDDGLGPNSPYFGLLNSNNDPWKSHIWLLAVAKKLGTNAIVSVNPFLKAIPDIVVYSPDDIDFTIRP